MRQNDLSRGALLVFITLVTVIAGAVTGALLAGGWGMAPFLVLFNGGQWS